MLIDRRFSRYRTGLARLWRREQNILAEDRVSNFLRGTWDFLVAVFAAEKAPYLMALFLAAVGWTVVRATDKLSSLPLVEYQFGKHSGGLSEMSGVRLRNITTATRFPCFVISLVALENSGLRFDDKPHSVLIRGAVMARVSKLAIEGDAAQFSIKDFAPGGDVEISVHTSGSATPGILASSCPVTSSAEKSTMSGGEKVADPILVPRSLKSVMVENESAFLWSGLAIWFVLLLIMLKSSRPAGVAAISKARGGRDEG